MEEMVCYYTFYRVLYVYYDWKRQCVDEGKVCLVEGGKIMRRVKLYRWGNKVVSRSVRVIDFGGGEGIKVIVQGGGGERCSGVVLRIR